MRIFYALSLLTAALALLAGGGFDWLLEWAHNALACPSSSAAASGRSRPRPLDAVVVLGYALARDGSPSAALEHRVRSGLREWRRASRERQVKLVFSGGHPGGGLVGNRSEAEVMWSLASDLLLLSDEGREDDAVAVSPPSEEKERDWLLEEASTSTWENAVESLELLLDLSRSNRRSSSSPEKGKKGRRPVNLSVSIATSPFHQRRALATFRCAAARRGEREREQKDKEAKEKRAPPASFSFSVAPLASPKPPPAGPLERLERAFEAAREVAAIGWYWARGRLCGGKGEGEENEEL